MYLEVDPHGDTLIVFQDANNQPSSPDDTVKEAASEDEFLVSRKHLMLASRRADKVLGGSFKEGTPEDDGRFYWRFEPIFDPEAFGIVMKIVHGQTRDIPMTIDVPLLAQISTVVDDLECHDAVWFFAKGWLNQVKGQIPNGICEDLMRWILISFVFEETEIFNRTTETAIRHGIDAMPTFNLPIRSQIFEDIGVRRENMFSSLFTRLLNLESQLLEQSLGCNQGCRAMLLGTLSQEMRSNSLSPLPPPPYISLSFNSTIQNLRAIEGLYHYCAEEDSTEKTSSERWELREETRNRDIWGQWYNKIAPSTLVRHECRLKGHLKGLLDATSAEIKGLELAQYLSA